MAFNINFILIHFGLYCGVEILKHHIFKSYKNFVFKSENVKTEMFRLQIILIIIT